jgi:hypothetical protein
MNTQAAGVAAATLEKGVPEMNDAEHPSVVTIKVGTQSVDVLLDWLSNSRYNAFVHRQPKGLTGYRLRQFVAKKLGELDSCGIEPEGIYDTNGCSLGL